MTAPAPQMYDATDVTLQTTLIPTGVITGGTTYGPTTYHAWNDKGSVLGSSDIINARLIVEADMGAGWQTSGHPIVDEGWVQVAITGVVNPGADSALQNQSTGYIPVSPFNPLSIANIPKNCARILSVKIVVPAGVGDTSPKVRLTLVANETVFPLVELASLASGGAIIPDRWDQSIRRLSAVAGGLGKIITASGTANVVVAARWSTYDGLPYYSIQETVTLNQTSASGALAVGESYIAVLSQAGGSSVVTTKGNRAASPTTPATPANSIFLGKVTVAYQGGGTSIINQGNVDYTAAIGGEFFVTPGTGLQVTIWPGTAITTADTEIRLTTPTTLAVAALSDLALWVLQDGTFTTKAFPGVPPSENAIYIARVETGAATVSIITNDNLSVGRAIDTHTMFLRFKGPLVVGADLDLDTLPWGTSTGLSTGVEWYLERIFVDVGVAGGGAGSTIIDINYRNRTVQTSTLGTTIYTSQGTFDRRPTLTGAINIDPDSVTAYGDASHEVRTFKGGDRFSFDIDAVQAVAPNNVIIQLQFRRLR